MFEFEQPAVLLLLVIPVWMGYWIWIRKGHPVILPFDHGTQSSGRGWFFLINLFESLVPVILAMAICIWAMPKKHDIPKKERQITNIQILLDCSGSMVLPFGEKLTPEGRFWNRFDASEKAIKEFIKYRKGDAFGFTAYSDTVIHWVPLTFDTQTIANSINFVRPHSGRYQNTSAIPGLANGTQTGKALLACIPELEKRPEGDRMILLISDGLPGDLRGQRAAHIANQLADANIIVHAVYINNNPPSDSFYQVVQGTGGKVFEVDNPETMQQVFKEIDTLQKAKILNKRPLPRDDFFLFSVIGLVATALHLLSSFTFRYTPW